MPREPLAAPEGEKDRYLRWMGMMWERNQTNARGEGRKQEALGVFEGLAELSRQRVEAPHFPPWESPW